MPLSGEAYVTKRQMKTFWRPPSDLLISDGITKLEKQDSNDIMEQTLKQFDIKIQTLIKISTILKSQLAEIYDDNRNSSLSIDAK